MTNKQTLIGWAQAFFAVLILWSISNVFLGYTIRTQGSNPIVYSCIVFSSAALALIAYAGPGKLAKETMHSMDTWGYGISLMLNYIALLALLAMVTSTEATLLQSISVVISLVSGWFFLGRPFFKSQFIGSIFICAGLFFVLSDVPKTALGQIIVIVIAMGIIQTARTFIAEFHRPHKQADKEESTIKDRARVVALVMFVVSTLFFVSFLGLSLLMHFTKGLYIPTVPPLTAFFNPFTVLYGMIAGVLLIAPLRFFEFSATSRIKTENYLAVSVFAAAATWGWEWATSPLTHIDMRQLSNTDALACAFITCGGLIIALRRLKKESTPIAVKENLYQTLQNLSEVEDTRELIASALEHFGNDIIKTAKALNIDPIVIRTLLEDTEKTLAFKPEVLKDVARAYRRNVAGADALTGLANRSTFMQALKNAPIEADIYSVLFIDLNKFKPVNDTYGHEAGDAILRGVAERLNTLFPKRSLSCRLGGDEFCVLLLDTNKEDAKKHAQTAITALNTPFEVQYKTITVGAAIGIASAPEDGTDGETLLKCADKNMYKDKAER